MKVYLAGPMTGYPQFNFPLFDKATDHLRAAGFEVVSPAEEDRKRGLEDEVTNSKDGDASKLSKTWGEILAYDVQLIADTGIEGIVFLPGWEKSKGARLEAFVALQSAKIFSFFAHDGRDGLIQLHPMDVLAAVYRGSRNHVDKVLTEAP